MKPVPQRKLKAQMALRDLSSGEVSKRSGVPYSTTIQILNGRLIHPEYLRRIKNAILSAPVPQEAGV
jgi:predicted transcriptional regulator